MKPHLIFDWDHTIWNTEGKGGPYPDAEVVIPKLRELATLSLLTHGDESFQLGKLGRCTFSDAFNGKIWVVPNPGDKRSILELIQKKATDYHSIWVIGDRRDLEIQFAIELKLNSIWVRRGRHATRKLTDSVGEPTHEVSDLIGVLTVGDSIWKK